MVEEDVVMEDDMEKWRFVLGRDLLLGAGFKSLLISYKNT